MKLVLRPELVLRSSSYPKSKWRIVSSWRRLTEVLQRSIVISHLSVPCDLPAISRHQYRDFNCVVSTSLHSTKTFGSRRCTISWTVTSSCSPTLLTASLKVRAAEFQTRIRRVDPQGLPRAVDWRTRRQETLSSSHKLYLSCSGSFYCTAFTARNCSLLARQY